MKLEMVNKNLYEASVALEETLINHIKNNYDYELVPQTCYTDRGVMRWVEQEILDFPEDVDVIIKLTNPEDGDEYVDESLITDIIWYYNDEPTIYSIPKDFKVSKLEDGTVEIKSCVTFNMYI